MGKIGEQVSVRISELKPYPKNAKKHGKDQIERIAKSIKEFGFLNPVLIDKENNVIAGHGRIEACKKLKMDEVPCLYVEGLTEEQRKAYILADNRLGELADWDMELVNEELLDLQAVGFDIDVTGFDLSLPVEPTEVVEDDFEVVVPEEPTAQRGQIWVLGNHRLMCGDSTSEDDVMKLVDGEDVDVVLTDPPYGINIVKANQVGGDSALHFESRKGGWVNIVPSSTYKVIEGDDTTETAKKNTEIIRKLSKNQIVFGGNYFTDFLEPSRCWIVWDKKNTGNFADVELAWCSFDKGAKLYSFMWNGLAREGSRKVEGVHRTHPTQKPVGLMGSILRDFSNDGDIILDCFGGSGSVMIACEQLNRSCRMMEIDPHYCDVIINRWEQFTGKKAELINDGKGTEQGR